MSLTSAVYRMVVSLILLLALMFGNYLVLFPPWDQYFSTWMQTTIIYAAIAPIVHGFALFLVIRPSTKLQILVTTLWVFLVYVVVVTINMTVIANISAST